MITNRFKSPLDRAAISLMAVLMVLTILLLIVGDHTAPYVRDFSWLNQEIGSEDTAFTITFSRSMERAAVESQLNVTRLPTLNNPSERLPINKIFPGRISWAGKKMLYTLNQPVPYGNKYQLELQGAKAVRDNGRAMSPFAGKFAVRDRLFAYIGTEGNTKGRLVIDQFGKNPEIVLTPANVIVTDFRFAPKGTALVYSAISAADSSSLLASQQIYRVPIDRQQPVAPSELILDSKEYQNVKFDLAPDGQTLVVQRVNRQNAKDAGIWSLRLEPEAKPQKISQGGDFLITPDSAAIAVAEGEGVAITPLTPEVKPWDFLPKFGLVLSFAKDGRAAAMVKFNNDYTRALFLVTNQGEQKELLKINGDFKTAQFSPNGKELYCITEVKETEDGMPQPYLIAIDIATTKAIPLLKLPQQQGILMSLSPDGRALMFDQVVTGKKIPGEQKLSTPDGQAIQQGMIWLMPLPPSIVNFRDKIQPEQLPVAGFYPQWVP